MFSILIATALAFTPVKAVFIGEKDGQLIPIVRVPYFENREKCEEWVVEFLSKSPIIDGVKILSGTCIVDGETS